jgi:hypothetical protein
MEDSIIVCHEIKNDNYVCKNFTDFIEFGRYYKEFSGGNLIMIPTKNYVNYTKDDIIKTEIVRHLLGDPKNYSFTSKLMKSLLCIKYE